MLIFGSLIRFLASGSILNLIGLILFFTLVTLGIRADFAALLGSLVLLPAAFIANRKFVFNDEMDAANPARRFVYTYVLVVTANYFFLRYILVKFPGKEMFAQVCFLVLTVMLSYLAQKLWVFRRG